MSTNGATPAVEQLQNRLNDPDVANGLNRLLDRLDTISFAVESMEGFISRGEVIADSIADSVGDIKSVTQNSGAEDLVSKAPQLLETGTKLAGAATQLNVDELAQSDLLARLTEPQTLETLGKLLDRLPLAAFLLESLEGFISRGETIADNLADGVKELHFEGIDFDTEQFKNLLLALPKFKEAGEKLLDSELLGEGLPKVIDAGIGMVDSGMLDKEVVTVLGELGRKSAQTYEEVSSRPVEPIGGLFATLRATKDPDVQKSVGFFFAFAKAFAKHLK